jgi:hypothetical protein
MANTQREIEQRAKAVFERCVALDLAANVTDDAAKPRAQKLQLQLKREWSPWPEFGSDPGNPRELSKG